MKLNIIQKFILLVILLLLIVLFLFFIPIREYRTTYIVYKSIFYTAGKIDFLRLVIQTFLIFLIGVFLFFSTSGLKNINWHSTTVKRIIKREFKYFGLFVLIVAILCSIVFLINFYQLEKRNKIEYLISKQNHSKDSLSNLIDDKELLRENFAKDIGLIIDYSKVPKADYFKKLIENDEINKTDDSSMEEGISFSEKRYYLFDKITIISKNKLDFVDFLNVIKGIKIVNLKNSEAVLTMKKVQTNSSKDKLNFNLNAVNKQLDLLSIKEVINILPYYQKLASEPKLFLEKIKGLIDNGNSNVVEFNILIDKIKLSKTNLKQITFIDSHIIEQVYVILALFLFFLLFIVRYASYFLRNFINYLK